MNVDVPEMDFGTVSSALIAALRRISAGTSRRDAQGVANGFAPGLANGALNGSERSIDDGAVAGQAAPVFLYADGPGTGRLTNRSQTRSASLFFGGECVFPPCFQPQPAMGPYQSLRPYGPSAPVPFLEMVCVINAVVVMAA